MYAPTGRGEKWVMNSEGIVLEYSSDPFHKSDEIIAGINAHYGTSFYQEDDIDKDFTIGETMPNWNAYEKILLPEKVNFRFLMSGSSAYVTGFMQGDKAYLNAQRENAIWNVSSEGEIWGSLGKASNYEEQTKTLLLSNFGRQISEVLPFVVEWQQGAQVPNWESYTLLS